GGLSILKVLTPIVSPARQRRHRDMITTKSCIVWRWMIRVWHYPSRCIGYDPPRVEHVFSCGKVLKKRRSGTGCRKLDFSRQPPARAGWERWQCSRATKATV